MNLYLKAHQGDAIRTARRLILLKNGMPSVEDFLERLRMIPNTTVKSDGAGLERPSGSAYVETALLQTEEMHMAPADFDRWVMWARREADRIDPLKNATVVRAIKELLDDD